MRQVQEARDFIFSTYFADGLRITIGVVLPCLILAQYGLLQVGMTIALGALCASLADTPGPIVHRRNAMMATCVAILVASLVTGLGNLNTYVMGVLIVALCFFFSMFHLYGNRAASIGTAALLVMVLGIGDIRPVTDILLHTLLIFAGGVWYTLLSISLYHIMPYRLAQQSLSDCILEVGEFLRTKALFYREKVNYEENFKKLLQLQVSVHEKQDAVREMLFKTREIVRDSTPEGRFLILVFVDVVDLFEQVMSTYYNYENLHKQFDHLGILSRYESIIRQLATQLDHIGYALKTGSKPHISSFLQKNINALKKEILELEANDQADSFSHISLIALKNIEVNLENIFSRITTIAGYFKHRDKRDQAKQEIDISKFVNRQPFDIKLFRENLTLKSQICRHALRVSIVMLTGFIIAQSFDFIHSNWILLTILVILKPGFSLTKQRNYQRLMGTIIGAFVGMGILAWVSDKNWLFAILVVCMIGAYSFQRKNYIVSVLFMTPYVLVLFDFLGMGNMTVARERIYDTLIGGAIAFLASNFLLPSWEYEKVKQAMTDMLRANAEYFRQVSSIYFGDPYERTAYKLARKEVYVNSANLASAFQRMFSEPKSKQLHIKEIHQFSVLNHLLSSYIATLALYAKEHFDVLPDLNNMQPLAENTVYLLNESADVLEKQVPVTSEASYITVNSSMVSESEESATIVIPEQFGNIQKLSYDIYKVSQKLVN